MMTIGSDSFDASSAKLVQYNDSAPFGTSGSGTAWLLRGDIHLSRGDSLVVFALNVLLDHASGRLVAAYTDARAGPLTCSFSDALRLGSGLRGLFEPPRDCRRLYSARGRSHGQNQQIFPRRDEKVGSPEVAS
jgi:hypothetical protein